MRYAIVGIGCLVLFIAIWVVDAWLYTAGWPTISQTVIYGSHITYLVPAIIGMVVGGLFVHWWEGGDKK